MARTKKKYANGQKRTSDGMSKQRTPKDYRKQTVKFFGSESAYQAFLENGRRDS